MSGSAPRDPQTTTAAIGAGSESGADSLWDRVSAISGVFTAAAALFAAAAYTGMSVAVESVYSKAHVQPSEVGLGYTNLLPASATVIAVILLPFVVFTAQGIAYRWWFVRRRRAAGTLRGRFQRWVLIVSLLGGVGYSIAFALAYVVPGARDARDALTAGRVYDGFGPWQFQTARVVWLKDAPSRPQLPTCMLLLGRADNVIVLFDARRQEAMRIPTAEVAVVSNIREREC